MIWKKGIPVHVSIDHVTKTIKGETVLNDICLELESGSVYGLRGKNGSGKTMLLRVLCGLVVPSGGRVIVDGEALHEGERSFPASVGVLIENPGIIRSYSGFRYLQSVASVRGIASDEDIVRMMQRLGLDPLSRKPLRSYSLGMRQKIGIIEALMEKPELVLLDEPFNALDDGSVREVVRLIDEMRTEGALIVVSSHDREELDLISDVVVNMRGGCVTGIERQGAA